MAGTADDQQPVQIMDVESAKKVPPPSNAPAPGVGVDNESAGETIEVPLGMSQDVEYNVQSTTADNHANAGESPPAVGKPQSLGGAFSAEKSGGMEGGALSAMLEEDRMKEAMFKQQSRQETAATTTQIGRDQQAVVLEAVKKVFQQVKYVSSTLSTFGECEEYGEADLYVLGKAFDMLGFKTKELQARHRKSVIQGILKSMPDIRSDMKRKCQDSFAWDCKFFGGENVLV